MIDSLCVIQTLGDGFQIAVNDGDYWRRLFQNDDGSYCVREVGVFDKPFSFESIAQADLFLASLCPDEITFEG